MYGYMIYLYLITCADAFKDMCDESDTRIVYKAVYNDSGVIHCFFQPPNDSAVPIILPSNGVDIEAARDQCRKYEAGLLQIKDVNMYVFVMRQGMHGIPRGSREEKMVLCKYEYAWFPLGIHNYSYHPDAPTINVTWDNGVRVELRVYGGFYNLSGMNTTFPWPSWESPEEAGVTYLMMGDGKYKTTNETAFQEQVELLCHQDPNHPITTSKSVSTTTSNADGSTVPPMSQTKMTTVATSAVQLTSSSQASATLNHTLITFTVFVSTRPTTNNKLLSTDTKLKPPTHETTSTVDSKHGHVNTKPTCSDVNAKKNVILFLIAIILTMALG